MEKMTNKKALEVVLEKHKDTLPSDVVAKVEGMIEQLAKKSASRSASGKMTATQKANADLKAKMLEQMVVDKAYTCSDIIAELPCAEGLSTSKVSAMVNQLEKDHLIEKTTVKGRSYFTKK